jgi:hypothetical protein
MDNVVVASNVTGFPDEDIPKLDRAKIPYWTSELRNAEASIRRLRLRLEALVSSDTRVCPECSGAVTGRPDRIYCSGACRQRAYRRGPGRERGAPSPRHDA